MAPPIIRALHDVVEGSNIFAARDALLRRNNEQAIADSHKGIINPESINNNALFALFGLIPAAMVVVGIWFFFWARNGGFYFKDDDWDDYKSTVLRRKGPNGTLLTGATPSTVLGGGSVYKDVDDGSTDVTGDTRTVVTESTEMTGITGGVSDFAGREKRRKKREAKERDRERRREEKKLSKENKSKPRKVDAEGNVVDEEAEAEAKAHLRNYRHERPARVGGINKESESSQWDGSTNPSASSAGGSGYGMGSEVTSSLMDDRQATPTNSPAKPKSSGGIRKVYSTADKREDREREHLRAEGRRLQEKGRSAAASSGSPRRNFSFQRADDTSAFTSSAGGGGSRLRQVDERTEAESSRVPGSWAESDAGSEVGTKTYRHVIPGLSSSGGSAVGTETTDFAYQDEKRKARRGAGYRRGRDAE